MIDSTRFNYINFVLSCSVTNCGINEQTGFAMNIGGGQEKIDNANFSSNKCKQNAGYDLWYGDPEPTGKYIIVTNCNSSEYLNEFVCYSPYGIANSFVSIVQNNCGNSVVYSYYGYDVRFDNCIFLENHASYGFKAELDSNAFTVTNSFVSLRTKTGRGKLILKNLRNDIFSIYRDLNDNKNCNNVYLAIVKIKIKCSYVNNIYSRLLLTSIVNLVYGLL